MYVEKYKSLLINLNKGGILTFDMVKQAITTGNINIVEKETDTKTFFSIWEEKIYELKTNDNGSRYTTSESYECALKSFRKIMGQDSIKGFNISAAEIQKWKDGMHNGVKDAEENLWVRLVTRPLASIYVLVGLYGIAVFVKVT